MKIAVNTRFLLPHRLEGIGWFTYEIFERLVKRFPQHDFIFYFDRPYKERFVFGSNVMPIVLHPQARHPILWKLWFNVSLQYSLAKHKPDVFISPDGYIPLPNKVKSIAVIHDINFEHNPEYLLGSARKYFLKYFRKFAQQATRVATVSKFSKTDIAQTYHIALDKIDLVYNGIGDFFKPLSVRNQAQIRQEYTDGASYFVFVGALNPRKNLEGMLAAYTLYRNQGGTNKFVIVGTKMYWPASLENCIAEHPFKKDLIFSGRLEREGLNKVLASAEALLFISHFEGFGIPMIEAFQCEIPVITSTKTSLPEVADGAALLCEPDDHAGIAKAMFEVAEPDIRKTLIAKGKERAAFFTWEKSADMMWESIEKCLASEKA